MSDPAVNNMERNRSNFFKKNSCNSHSSVRNISVFATTLKDLEYFVYSFFSLKLKYREENLLAEAKVDDC